MKWLISLKIVKEASDNIVFQNILCHTKEKNKTLLMLLKGVYYIFLVFKTTIRICCYGSFPNLKNTLVIVIVAIVT